MGHEIKKKTCKSIFVALNLILVVILSCDHTTRAIMSPINDLVTGSDCHFFPFVKHSYLMRFENKTKTQTTFLKDTQQQQHLKIKTSTHFFCDQIIWKPTKIH